MYKPGDKVRVTIEYKTYNGTVMLVVPSLTRRLADLKKPSWFESTSAPMMWKRKNKWFYKRDSYIVDIGVYKRKTRIAWVTDALMEEIETPDSAASFEKELKELNFTPQLGQPRWNMVICKNISAQKIYSLITHKIGTRLMFNGGNNGYGGILVGFDARSMVSVYVYNINPRICAIVISSQDEFEFEDFSDIIFPTLAKQFPLWEYNSARVLVPYKEKIPCVSGA